MAIPRPPTEEEAAEAAANAEAGAETKVETEEAESEFDQDRLEDAYLAKTVAERALRGRYVWCFDLGWMGYRGGVWRHVADDHVVERVRVDMIKQFEQEARDHALGGRLKELARLLATGKIRSVAGLCRGILEITADKFDAHPDLLNVGNGVIDLRNSTLLEHDPNLYLTKITKVPYRAAAKSDDWDTALEALPAGVRTWMQLRFGQAATGYPTSDDLLTVSQGSGANGKSTVFVGVQRALGEHATVIPEKAIIGNPNDHSTELMTLRGARFAMIEELPEGRHFNIKRLKDVVGTPTITGRLMRKNNTTFSTTHSLFITSNYRPRIDEVDHGSWRRLALVRFPYVYGDGTNGTRPRIEGLRERIKEGRQGQHEATLAWIVDGARRWYAAGRILPPPPAQVVKDTKEWRATADLILAFIEDNLIFDKDHYVVAQDLYEHFVDYLRDQGHQTWAIQKFADRFGQHALVEGHHVVKQMIRSTYQGKLSRKTITHTTPIRFAAWLGVRYRTVEDDRENDQETSTSSNVGMDGMGGSVNAQDSHFARVNIGIHAIHANNGQDQDQDQNDVLKSLAGRCGACGFHIATQGHAGDCTVGARQQAKDRASKIKKAVRDARRS